MEAIVLMTEYNLKYPTQRKIKERMDQLQSWMESNYHLEHPQEVEDLIRSVSKFWGVMQEEDTDYIHVCRYAIENKSSWSV